MTSNVQYQIYHDNETLSQELAEKIEEIIVDQEIDLAWEARLKVRIFVDDQGNWTEESRKLMKSFSRIRVEVSTDESGSVALIDGPVVGFNMTMSSDPGESFVSIIVQDDSVYLNQNDEIEIFENKTDDQIAQEILSGGSHISSTEVDFGAGSAGNLPPTVVQRGTAIQFLKFLAKRQAMYAYVLPGSSPGNSIGCFKALPTTAGNLTALILLGPNRNIDSFTVQNNAQLPSNASASSLLISDKSIITSTSSTGDINLLGDEIGYESEEFELPEKILPPDLGESIDLDQVVKGESERLSYSIIATGNILRDNYPDILLPYSIIAVSGVNALLSGDYLISQVTHTITPSSYTQSFTLKRNAHSTSLGGLGSLGAIF